LSVLWIANLFGSEQVHVLKSFERYAAEENLESCPAEEITHPKVGKFFQVGGSTHICCFFTGTYKAVMVLFSYLLIPKRCSNVKILTSQLRYTNKSWVGDLGTGKNCLF
jgi:hypothetical protein